MPFFHEVPCESKKKGSYVRGKVENAKSITQRCAALSTSEIEYVALVQGTRLHAMKYHRGHPSLRLP